MNAFFELFILVLVAAPASGFQQLDPELPAPAPRPAIEFVVEALAEHDLVAISEDHELETEHVFLRALISAPRFHAVCATSWSSPRARAIRPRSTVTSPARTCRSRSSHRSGGTRRSRPSRPGTRRSTRSFCARCASSIVGVPRTSACACGPRRSRSTGPRSRVRRSTTRSSSAHGIPRR